MQLKKWFYTQKERMVFACSHASKSEVLSLSGSLAYTTVLSLVPLVAVAFYFFNLFGGVQYAYSKLMPSIFGIFSSVAGPTVQKYLLTFTQKVQKSSLGLMGFIGLFITAAMTYITVLGAFQKIWNIQHQRSLHYKLLRALILFFIAPFLLSASVSITTILSTNLKKIPWTSSLVAFGFDFLLFFFFYTLVPTQRMRLKFVAQSAALVAILFEAAKIGYAFYTKKVVSYSVFYGSFAAIPVFFLWIYIMWVITLFGAVWIYTLQTEKERWFQRKQEGKIYR